MIFYVSKEQMNRWNSKNSKYYAYLVCAYAVRVGFQKTAVPSVPSVPWMMSCMPRGFPSINSLVLNVTHFMLAKIQNF